MIITRHGFEVSGLGRAFAPIWLDDHLKSIGIDGPVTGDDRAPFLDYCGRWLAFALGIDDDKPEA